MRLALVLVVGAVLAFLYWPFEILGESRIPDAAYPEVVSHAAMLTFAVANFPSEEIRALARMPRMSPEREQHIRLLMKALQEAADKIPWVDGLESSLGYRTEHPRAAYEALAQRVLAFLDNVDPIAKGSALPWDALPIDRLASDMDPAIRKQAMSVAANQVVPKLMDAFNVAYLSTR